MTLVEVYPNYYPRDGYMTGELESGHLQQITNPQFVPVIILLMLFLLSRGVIHQSRLPVLTSTRS